MPDPATGPAIDPGATVASAADRLVVALDEPTLEGALARVDGLAGACRRFKVGLELFTVAGPAAVAAIRERGGSVFLDLKLHDIPETVGRAVRAAAELGADLLTVHAGGGREMLRRAAEAAAEAARTGRRVRVLGVTVLTSLELADLREVGVQAESVEELVARRAALCAEAGLDGVVCSPREASALRARLPRPFLLVTPGVRPEGAVADEKRDDQKRTGSARQAIRDGADLLVVGRPLRRPDARLAAEALLGEIAAGLRDAAGDRGGAP